MPTTLQNLNEGCGFSGTDASMLELARGLATGTGTRHVVRVLSGGPARTDKVETADSKCGEDGVIHYLSPERNFLDAPKQVSDLSTVDVLILVYLMPEAHLEMIDLFRRLPNPLLRVFLWCHSVFTSADVVRVETACLERQIPLMLVGVSDFVREHLSAAGHAKSYITIPNAINPYIFDDAGRDEREPNSFIFCASYERGGAVARSVHALLKTRHALPSDMPIGALYLCSYCDTAVGPSMSKDALASRMRKCEYMVYPLVLSSGSVHHDTYACCVLEAMASGVLVVSWDVACLRGVFGDLITLVTPPAFMGYDPHARSGTNKAMLEDSSVTLLADAVSVLMALTPAQRETRRLAARSWALQQTWDKRVASLVLAINTV